MQLNQLRFDLAMKAMTCNEYVKLNTLENRNTDIVKNAQYLDFIRLFHYALSLNRYNASLNITVNQHIHNSNIQRQTHM